MLKLIVSQFAKCSTINLNLEFLGIYNFPMLFSFYLNLYLCKTTLNMIAMSYRQKL